MGYYLNCTVPLELYRSQTNNPYFVDKTKILTELIPMLAQGQRCICITRPRRFGKSVMAAMVGAYFGKGTAGKEVFDKLAVAACPACEQHRNRYNLIYVDFSKIRTRSKTMAEYLDKLNGRVWEDLQEVYPQVPSSRDEFISEYLHHIYVKTGEKFVFVFDEWDYIFHKEYVTDADRRDYLDFLADLTKDRAYVQFVYMTGVLPIAKYTSGSSLNHFEEYTMVNQKEFNSYFGFTDAEVDGLYERYLINEENPAFTREELRNWYDGYYTESGLHMYNPRSVSLAFNNNHLQTYWTRSGPYDEVADYIVNRKIPGLYEKVALMVAGEAIPVTLVENAITTGQFGTLSEIFSAMVVYGFLNYYRDEMGRGMVCIPNKELMDEFARAVQSRPEMGYIYELAKKSGEMLEATLQGDTDTMAEILEYAHNTESAILQYNHETELSAIVTLVYLAARDIYDIRREEKGGRGFVDFVFLPKYNKAADCILLELKKDDTPENALAQIREKQYYLRLRGKIGEKPLYTGRILAYGIAYDSTTGKHRCRLEIFP